MPLQQRSGPTSHAAFQDSKPTYHSFRALKSDRAGNSPKITSDFTKRPLGIKDLIRSIDAYLLDCQYRLNSKSTVENRRIFLDKLLWFLEHRDFRRCGTYELNEFFLYLTQGHRELGGRWGIAHFDQPLRPISIRDYYVTLQLFFDWLVKRHVLLASPLTPIPIPHALPEPIQPFTSEQILALVQAARRSSEPLRNEAIVWFLLDTGVRASELCGLRVKNLDLRNRRCLVLGKGNKQRAVYIGRGGPPCCTSENERVVELN